MSLTIENPVVEARLRAFASAHGKTVEDAIATLLDDIKPASTLSVADVEALSNGLDQLDKGQGIDGVAFLENLRQREGLPARETGFVRRETA